MSLSSDTDPRLERTGEDSMPVVPLPRAGFSGAAIAVVCGLLALLLFFILDGNRRQRQATSQHSISLNGMIGSPAPLQVPAEPPAPPAQKPVITIIEPPRRSIAANARAPQNISTPQWPASFSATASTSIPLGSPLDPSLSSTPMPHALGGGDAQHDPVLIVDTGTSPTPNSVGVKGGDGGDALASDDSAVRATLIRNRTMLVPQGTVLNAVLETPIDSTRPGLVRAIVSRDTRGFDGSRVLIPRGSRLIGQADGDIKPGQKRVLVQWTRLIRPDGVAIRIGSPASDTLGGAGINGHVNNHFLTRFANAALQSALTAGVAIASSSAKSPYAYILPGQLMGATQSLFPDVAPGATIKVRAGTEIAVFVARDLDFSGTSPFSR